MTCVQPGYYCASVGLSAPTGQCRAGYRCPSASTTDTALPCDAGGYCPAASSVSLPCPSGTYSTSQRNEAASNCTQCVPGAYCNATGLTAPSGLCDAGYFCAGGNSQARPAAGLCGLGTACPQGSSAAVGCPAGRYSDQVGQSTCAVCPVRLSIFMLVICQFV
jgi:hypothetical protein